MDLSQKTEYNYFIFLENFVTVLNLLMYQLPKSSYSYFS